VPKTPRATPPLLKALNERAILELIRADAPISRAQISRRAGISKPTVSLALESLLAAGLVREAARGRDGPSYGAVFFEPVPEAALVLGLDLGARFLRGALCDLTGAIRARQDVEVVATDADHLLDAIVALRAALVETSGLPNERIDSVVIGVPGVVDATDGVTLATNVPGIEGQRFRHEASDRLSLPVALENDINLAAVGEQWAGIARGVDDFAFLSIGTGLGSGIVMRGEIHRGHNGAAGELDYARAGHEDFDPCASALTLLAARFASERTERTSLAPPYDGPAVFAAARRGDEVAHAVVAEEARRIALHIVPIAAVADVELVVLGGGIGAHPDLLLEPIRALLVEWLPYPPRVEVSSLGEAAVLTGALALGRRAALHNVFVNSRERAASEASDADVESGSKGRPAVSP
jgi:predicted NBD/HSP70 family sugar kinase